MMLPIQITSDNEPGMEIAEALLDSGASGKFIDEDYARDIHVEKKDLRKPITVYNVDGTPNKQGTITQYVELYLTIHKRKRKQRLLVTGLGRQQIILGYPWLKEMNPLIDWEKGTLEWRKWKNLALKRLDRSIIEYYTLDQGMINDGKKNKLASKKKQPGPETLNGTSVTMEEVKDEEEHLNSTQRPLDKNNLSEIIATITDAGETDFGTWINAKQTNSTKIQSEINLKKKDLPLEEQIPKEFHEYLDVFSEEKAT